MTEEELMQRLAQNWNYKRLLDVKKSPGDKSQGACGSSKGQKR